MSRMFVPLSIPLLGLLGTAVAAGPGTGRGCPFAGANRPCQIAASPVSVAATAPAQDGQGQQHRHRHGRGGGYNGQGNGCGLRLRDGSCRSTY